MTRNKSRYAGWRAILFLAVAFLAPAAFGGSQPSLYNKETSVDLFGSYLAAQQGISHVFDHSPHPGSYGGGIGVNYFTTPMWGIGTDINIADNGGSFIDSTTANIILRVPLGKSGGAAPYVFGGGGSAYEPSVQWIGQVGVGLEYRSDSKLGVFFDGRYVWGQKSDTDQLLLRAGLRFVY